MHVSLPSSIHWLNKNLIHRCRLKTNIHILFKIWSKYKKHKDQQRRVTFNERTPNTNQKHRTTGKVPNRSQVFYHLGSFAISQLRNRDVSPRKRKITKWHLGNVLVSVAPLNTNKVFTSSAIEKSKLMISIK
jgi:hypothetical protein